jgi:hypothetical protein
MNIQDYAKLNFPKNMVLQSANPKVSVEFLCTRHKSNFILSWSEFVAQKLKPRSAHGGRRSVCPECLSGIKLKLSGKNNPAYKGGGSDFQKSLDEKFGAGVLSLVGKYSFLHNPVSVKHNECGNVKNYNAASAVLKAKYPCRCARIRAIAPFHSIKDKQKDFIIFCYTKLLYHAEQIRDLTGVPATTVMRVLNEAGVVRARNELSTARKVDNLLQGADSSAWSVYNRMSRIITGFVIRAYRDILDPRGLHGVDFHIDHMLSKYDAFSKHVRPVDLRIVCHPANLRLVGATTNLSKNKKSSLSLSKLKSRIKKFELRHGKVEFPDNYEYVLDRDKSQYVSSDGLRVLAFDPGTKNFGVFGGVLHGASTVHAIKPMVSTMLKSPVTSLTGDTRDSVSQFLGELEILFHTIEPDVVVIERFQTRGLMGTTVELVGFMIGIVAGFIHRRNSDHGLNTMTKLVVASQWKNAVNKKTDLSRMYSLLDGPHQHHRLDAMMMALYCFPGDQPYSFLDEDRERALCDYIRTA